MRGIRVYILNIIHILYIIESYYIIAIIWNVISYRVKILLTGSAYQKNDIFAYRL